MRIVGVQIRVHERFQQVRNHEGMQIYFKLIENRNTPCSHDGKQFLENHKQPLCAAGFFEKEKCFFNSMEPMSTKREGNFLRLF